MISLIVPTYNEKENIDRLLKAIEDVFIENKMRGEVIVVDDNSPDGTADLVKRRARQTIGPVKIRLLLRKKKSGLSSAVLDGFKKAKGPILGVMDADFSHPPTLLPKLIMPLKKNTTDIAVASRYVRGGRVIGWPHTRQITSTGARMLALPLTSIRDPISGYFFLHKKVIEDVVFTQLGFKLFLDILVLGRYKTVREIPMVFVNRKKGKSKLGLKENSLYVVQLLKLYKHKFLR